MKVVLTRDDVVSILKEFILQNYSHTLDVHQPSDIQFNDYYLSWEDLVFEKKRVEDVADMTAMEVLKTKEE